VERTTKNKGSADRGPKFFAYIARLAKALRILALVMDVSGPPPANSSISSSGVGAVAGSASVPNHLQNV